jgi:hypothetical protein
MTSPTYGQPIIEPDDIVERIDALIPRDATGTPLVWGKRAVPGMTLIYARNEIQRLRVRVEDLERALRHADKEAKP